MDFAEIEAPLAGLASLSATRGLVGTPNGTRTAYEPLSIRSRILDWVARNQ